MAPQINTLPLLLLSLLPLAAAAAAASTFDVANNCSYTVRAGAGGGIRLNPGQSWSYSVPNGTTAGRVWPRTACSFDSNGTGRCRTGDCGGVLACTGYGQNPNTLAEYSLAQTIPGVLDYFDISLVAGFNVPLSFKPTSNGCTSGPSCGADVNARCPAELQVPGGCGDPCTVFGTPEYCCPSVSSCSPTQYSEYFKSQCPQAFSYPYDDNSATFTCPGNTNYHFVFCP